MRLGRAKPPVPAVLDCPICGTRMIVRAETDLPRFAHLEIKRHELACDTCGMRTERAFHPSVGYRVIAR